MSLRNELSFALFSASAMTSLAMQKHPQLQTAQTLPHSNSTPNLLPKRLHSTAATLLSTVARQNLAVATRSAVAHSLSGWPTGRVDDAGKIEPPLNTFNVAVSIVDKTCVLV
jgi:hypothetical protein